MSSRIWCASILTGRQSICANPTSGEALYRLGDVPSHERLYREVDGDKEDEPVPRDGEHIHLNEDEHFYSRKVFKIFVNTDEHETDEKHITYTQVVELYLGSGGSPSNQYLVKYSHGPAENPSGTLLPDRRLR